MKKLKLWKVLLALALILLPTAVMAQAFGPIVSADWLEKNLKNPDLVIVDLRKVEDFRAGNIPGSVNVFYGSWAVKKGELLNELPPLDDLEDIIGRAGIGRNSLVVLADKVEKTPDQFNMTRVAWTLKYAGISNVAILNGGIDQWIKEKRALSTETTAPKAKPYKAQLNRNLVVDKAFVNAKLVKATIIDTRGPAFYEGKEKLPFVPKAGRIKGAVNLPVGQIYTAENLYKDKAVLASLATKVAGNDPSKEIILYCDTGKTCTGWAFLLTDMLGYKDVKIYDGSSQEWMADPAAPVEP